MRVALGFRPAASTNRDQINVRLKPSVRYRWANGGDGMREPWGEFPGIRNAHSIAVVAKGLHILSKRRSGSAAITERVCETNE